MPQKLDKSTRGAYDAIVYIEGSEVVAEDSKGRKIASGVAGTDDVATMQAANDSLPAAGGTMIVENGSYVAESTLFLDSGTHLFLSPAAKITRGAAHDISIIKNRNWNAGVVTDTNIIISGIGTLDGESATHPAGTLWYNQNLILLGYCSNSAIRDVRGTDSKHYGNVLYFCEDCKIDGVVESYGRGPALVAGTRNVINNINSFANTRGVFIGNGVTLSRVKNSTIRQSTAGYTVYFESSVYNTFIENCHLEASGLATGGIHADTSCSKLTFNGNMFSGGIAFEFYDGYDIALLNSSFIDTECDAHSDDLTIKGCTFRTNAKGIHAQSALHVSDCDFLGCSYGIDARSASLDGIVEKCKFYGCVDYGFYSHYAVDNLSILDCFFDGCGAAIRISAASTDTVVDRCTFQNNSSVFWGTTAANVNKIKNCIGYLTESSGSSTGTGSEQTIAHGLVSTPTKVVIVPTATQTFVDSWWADGTNIYVTVTSGKTFNWSAEV